MLLLFHYQSAGAALARHLDSLRGFFGVHPVGDGAPQIAARQRRRLYNVMSTTIQTNSRTTLSVLSATKTVEGAGFLVNRPFPSSGLADCDPFLLLDEMGPVDLGPNEAKGAPDHPHRGFETVTYLISGKMRHKDSQGHSGVLGPGDVQWMTAGAGVVHSEMPEDEFFRTGGRLHGFQLWVNLPQRDKMMRPRYQEIPREKIPTVVGRTGTSRYG
jgi:redox-sensitive bicupin YhaK (pirin superfamily)